ncbi:CRISPR-associated protein Csx20 [Desulfolithobacter sp.]
MQDLYLLFNHRLTSHQAEQAKQELGVDNIIEPPDNITRLWANIPPEPESIRPVLEPVFTWIDNEIRAGSFLLVQGDFGACFLVINHAAAKGITPVYSTTRREAAEQHTDDKTVRLAHTFRHVRFRIYGR